MSDVIRRPTFNVAPLTSFNTAPQNAPNPMGQPDKLYITIYGEIPFPDLVNAIAKSGGPTALLNLKAEIDKKLEMMGALRR
jgi:hypothetical protein